VCVSCSLLDCAMEDLLDGAIIENHQSEL
jgi:hypothetical protein